MRQFYVSAPNGAWQPVAVTGSTMPTGEVFWRGRTYDLSNVDELTQLAGDLERDNVGFEEQLLDADMAKALEALEAGTEGLNVEADRLRAQIAKDEAKTAALTEELHAQGISTASEDDVSHLLRQWKSEWGDTPGPAARPTTAREKAVRDQRDRAGF